MIERLRKTAVSLSLAAGTLAAGCGGGGYVEIPIQTPIAPKLDISPFQRVYVAGFLAGANDDVDANMETVRLLRSQLRNKNVLRVVDADTVPLAEHALEEVGAPEAASRRGACRRAGARRGLRGPAAGSSAGKRSRSLRQGLRRTRSTGSRSATSTSRR